MTSALRVLDLRLPRRRRSHPAAQEAASEAKHETHHQGHKGAGDDVTISVQGTCLWVPHGLKGDDLDKRKH